MLRKEDTWPLLMAFVLIVAGTGAAVWLSTLSHAEFQRTVSGFSNIMTIILTQPGVYITAKIIASEDLPIKWKLVWSAATVMVLVIAIPLGLNYFVQENLPDAYAGIQAAKNFGKH
jgi:hypothetical protein